jgi:glutamine phosphoribosylpyrophosphate amidotransferase
VPAIERDLNPEMSGEKCGVFAASFSNSFRQKLYSLKNQLNYFGELVKKAFATENFQDINSKPLVPVLLTLFRQAIWDPNFIEILVKEILESLNHRGPHGFGLAFGGLNGNVESIKHVGKIDESPLFEGEVNLPKEIKEIIGHLRYATTGVVNSKNAHPHYGESDGYKVLLSHNGNIEDLKELLEKNKLIKNPKLSELGNNRGDSDSALFAQAIAESPGENTIAKLKTLLPHIPPSYSCTMLVDEGIFAFRDRSGNRPLFLCEIEIGDEKSYIIASETVAFEKALARVGLDFNSENVKIREIEPGEIVQIDKDRSLTTDTFLDKVVSDDGETKANPVDKFFEGLENQELKEGNLREIISYLDSLSQELGTLPCFVETVYFAFSSSRIFTNPISAGGTGKFLTNLFEKIDQIITILNQNEGEDITNLKDQIIALKSKLEARKKGISEEQKKMLIGEARKQIGAQLFDNPEVLRVLSDLGFTLSKNSENQPDSNLGTQEQQISPEIPKSVLISYIPNGGKNFSEGLIKELIKKGVLPEGFKSPEIFMGSTQRVFLANTKEEKEKIAKEKFKIKKQIKKQISGKIILLVDDSLVRGTNVETCIKNLLELGAKKVIIVSAAPIFKNGCHLGVALKKEELLSTRAENNSQSQEGNNQILAQKMAAQLILEINPENGTYYSANQLELVFGDIDGIQDVVLPNGGFCTGCLK